MPIGYMYQTSALFLDALTQTDMKHFCKSLLHVFKFMTGGLVILLFSLVTDPIIFMLNLFIEAHYDEIKQQDNTRAFN